MINAEGGVQICRGCFLTSALPPKADMCSVIRHVCFGPIADIALATPFTIKRPPTEAASHGVLLNRLLLDLDDEAGRGLLRLLALSIEGLPGGRLEERYSIVDAVPFDDADIGRRRCALDGDDTAAQREKRLAVVVGNGLADGRQVLRHRGFVSYDVLADAVGLELGLGVQALHPCCAKRRTGDDGQCDFKVCIHGEFPPCRLRTVRPLAEARLIIQQQDRNHSSCSCSPIFWERLPKRGGCHLSSVLTGLRVCRAY